MFELAPIEVLREDYARTIDLYKMYVDIRFRLLGLVPVVSVVAVGLIGKSGSREVGVATAALGAIVTFGLIVYEVRNSQLHDSLVHRMKFLEQLLCLPASADRRGGIANERPSKLVIIPIWKPTANSATQNQESSHHDPQKQSGLLAWHDLALAIVYGSTIAGWVWLFSVSLFSARSQTVWWSVSMFGIAILLGVATGVRIAVLSKYGRPNGRVVALSDFPDTGGNAVAALVKTIGCTWKKGQEPSPTASDWFRLARQLGLVEESPIRLGKGVYAMDKTDRGEKLVAGQAREALEDAVYLLHDVSDAVEYQEPRNVRETVVGGGYAPWLDPHQINLRRRWLADLRIYEVGQNR